MSKQSDQSAPPHSEGIGLALSGGGFRATLFHLGVVLALRDLGKLKEVEAISCVSGGSILGAHLVLNWELYTSDDPEDLARATDELLDFVEAGIRSRIFMRVPWRAAVDTLARLLRLRKETRSTDQARTWLLEHYLSRLFHGQSLRSLGRRPGHAQARPEIYILSTNLSTSSLFAFNAQGILPELDLDASSGQIHPPSESMGAAKAAKIEAGHMSPSVEHELAARFESGKSATSATSATSTESAELVAEAGAEVGGGSRLIASAPKTKPPRSESHAQGQSKEEVSDTPKPTQSTVKPIPTGLVKVGLAVAASSAAPHFFPAIPFSTKELEIERSTLEVDPLFLTDGGVMDNSGESIFQEPLSGLIGTNTVDKVIASDASPPIDYQEQTKSVFLLAGRTIDILMKRLAASRDAPSDGSLTRLKISGGEKPHPFLDSDVQLTLKNVRTDLDSFSSQEVRALVRHGYGIARQSLGPDAAAGGTGEFSIMPVINRRYAHAWRLPSFGDVLRDHLSIVSMYWQVAVQGVWGAFGGSRDGDIGVARGVVLSSIAAIWLVLMLFVDLGQWFQLGIISFTELAVLGHSIRVRMWSERKPGLGIKAIRPPLTSNLFAGMFLGAAVLSLGLIPFLFNVGSAPWAFWSTFFYLAVLPATTCVIASWVASAVDHMRAWRDDRAPELAVLSLSSSIDFLKQGLGRGPAAVLRPSTVDERRSRRRAHQARGLQKSSRSRLASGFSRDWMVPVNGAVLIVIGLSLWWIYQSSLQNDGKFPDYNNFAGEDWTVNFVYNKQARFSDIYAQASRLQGPSDTGDTGWWSELAAGATDRPVNYLDLSITQMTALRIRHAEGAFEFEKASPPMLEGPIAKYRAVDRKPQFHSVAKGVLKAQPMARHALDFRKDRKFFGRGKMLMPEHSEQFEFSFEAWHRHGIHLVEGDGQEVSHFGCASSSSSRTGIMKVRFTITPSLYWGGSGATEYEACLRRSDTAVSPENLAAGKTDLVPVGGGEKTVEKSQGAQTQRGKVYRFEGPLFRISPDGKRGLSELCTVKIEVPSDRFEP